MVVKQNIVDSNIYCLNVYSCTRWFLFISVGSGFFTCTFRRSKLRRNKTLLRKRQNQEHYLSRRWNPYILLESSHWLKLHKLRFRWDI